MKKILKPFLGVVSGLLLVASVFSMQSWIGSVEDLLSKRMLFTSNGTSSGVPILDINAGGNIIAYGPLKDGSGNTFITGVNLSGYLTGSVFSNLTNNYVPFYSGGLWYNSKIKQTSNSFDIGNILYGASISMIDNNIIRISPDSMNTTFAIGLDSIGFTAGTSTFSLNNSGISFTSINSGIALNSLSGVYVNNKLTVSGNVVVGTVQDIGTGTKNSMSVGKDNILNANYSLVVGQDNDIVGTGVYFSMLVGYMGVMSDTLYSVGLGYKPYINSKNNTFLFAGSTGPKSAYKDKTFIVYADGGMGVDTNDPKTTLDVNGMIKIGNLTTACSSTIAGTMKYSGTNFYGCNGSSRVQLDN